MANGSPLPNDWDPSDDFMFLPLHVKGYRKEFADTLYFCTATWQWSGKPSNYVCQWEFSDTWPSTFRRQVAIKVRELLRDTFQKQIYCGFQVKIELKLK